MDRDALYDGKDFYNMYMTSLIQNIIDAGWDVRAALINRSWLEVDSVEDLEAYQSTRSDLQRQRTALEGQLEALTVQPLYTVSELDELQAQSNLYSRYLDAGNRRSQCPP